MTDDLPDGYDDPDFDRPDVDDVQQQQATDIPAVPVIAQGVTRVDQLPTELGICRNFVLAVSVPVKILDRDPRRRSAIFWVALLGDPVVLAGSAAECSHGVGAILPTTSTVPLRVEIYAYSELWAMAQPDAEPVGATLNVITELWSR